VALLIVLVLIGVFGLLAQAMTMLMAMQHRLAYQYQDQAQASWLAESAVLRGLSQWQSQGDWAGEEWKPAVPGGATAVARISIERPKSGRSILQVEATLTYSERRIHRERRDVPLPAAPVTTSTQP
jgi:hypothetical protein